MQAFILVQTEVGRASLVASQISLVTGVLTAEGVVGPYDVIVRVEAEDHDRLTAVVGQVQKVNGITRTLTCQVLGTGAATL